MDLVMETKIGYKSQNVRAKKKSLLGDDPRDGVANKQGKGEKELQ